MNELSTNIIRTFDDAERAARAMSASGFFPDSKQAAQAIVKILAGQELGFGPFASMTGVNIIQGKPTLGANLMAAAVKRGGKYDYRITEMTDTACEIEFYQNGKPVGKSRFTMDDAKKAGLTNKDNWTKYPRNMLFARALSNGQRWYAPDVFNGALVYTPDELGATTDEDGNAVVDAIVIDAEVRDHGKKFTPPPPDEPPSEHDDSLRYSPDKLKTLLTEWAGKFSAKPVSNAQVGLCAAMLEKCFADNQAEAKRKVVQFWLFGKESLTEAPAGWVLTMLEWLKPVKDSGGDYNPDPMAKREAQAVYTEAMRQGGQQSELFGA